MSTLSVPKMRVPSQYMYRIPPEFQALIVSYAGCVFLHYMAANIYPLLCTPVTWTGLVMTPFYAPMPHCRGLVWMIYTGNDAICHMWIGLGGWLVVVTGRYVFVRKSQKT